MLRIPERRRQGSHCWKGGAKVVVAKNASEGKNGTGD